jgi:hypothetical protein
LIGSQPGAHRVFLILGSVPTEDIGHVADEAKGAD